MLQSKQLAPFYLTIQLLPILEQNQPSRIVNISSLAHKHIIFGGLSLDKIQDQGSYNARTAYARSKACNILFSRELAQRLEKKNVKVCLNAFIGIWMSPLFSNKWLGFAECVCQQLSSWRCRHWNCTIYDIPFQADYWLDEDQPSRWLLNTTVSLHQPWDREEGYTWWILCPIRLGSHPTITLDISKKPDRTMGLYWEDSQGKNSWLHRCRSLSSMTACYVQILSFK